MVEADIPCGVFSKFVDIPFARLGERDNPRADHGFVGEVLYAGVEANLVKNRSK